ncbi:putative ATP-dependent DNA helicase chr12 [Stylosanthes scabra]|uniref:ATP-dependent DNA helicase chr12 n=1 Tax=Stylosanthes scabra TaxID=79078 RepID=A0ABU6U7W1_9FABA|nr:putative ATP-dependent DNA helicase chr12 [Stylosanthes scabra]
MVMAPFKEEQPQPQPPPIDHAKTLICALNFLSRDLPLPPHLLTSVFTIYHDHPSSLNNLQDDIGNSSENLITDLEGALLKQRPNCVSGSRLENARESRYQNRIQHRLTELEGLPSTRGEDLQTKCLLELYGLKLGELHSKVRSEVSSEYWLNVKCAYPDKQLFDWGMMRLQRPLYGVGDPFAMDADDQIRKKRDAERLSRLEEEEKTHIETRKRKFFAEILNTVREFQLQIQAAVKRRKQRNDGIQAWHGRQRQRATRAEKLRFQALKADDQEAYMRMVKESKNERLTTLLEETNKLLVNLGAAVQRQKDSKHSDGIEPLEDSEVDLPESDASKNEKESPLDEDLDMIDSDHNGDTSDLLEGQRQYNSAIHSIQEKVTEQPSILQGGELRPYQIEGLQWMLSLFNNNLNGILADEMGLGKTIQTISLVAHLMEHKGVTGPHLIVAPKAVLPNWMNEFSTWVPSITTILYDGRYHIQRRLLLTGTPIQNSLQELWSLLNFLLPNIFNSVQNFEDWFNAPFADRVDVSLTDEEQLLIIRRLHQVIRPFILRRKKDEVEKFLPSKSQVILKCDMSAWQKVYYQQVTDVGRVGLDNGSGKSKSLQNLTMQLRKCCNHPYLFVGDYDMYNRKEEIVRASGKFELLDRLLPKLRRAGHRVLLFSQMTRLMDILEIYLRLHDFKYLRLDGSTKTEERGSLLRKFNAPDSPYFMFLLSTRAGGLGLNLQTADTVIIFDSDWNPQMDQQAEDRAHRIGQKKEVRVFVLVSVGSIEEVILERAKQKMGIDAKVIQAGLFNTTSTAQDRREMLEEIMRRGTSSLGTDVPSEREINRLAARSDEEFWLFEKMDEERRLKENYRSRLMDEHELPDWVYSPLHNKDEKAKDFINGSATGKRKRKEVVYADTLSDVQWMKAVENGDLSRLSVRGKRREHLSSENAAQASHNSGAEERFSELHTESFNMANDRTSEDSFHVIPASKKPKLEGANSHRHAYEDVKGSGLNQHVLSWNTHRKKRSSYGQGSSSDTKGQSSNGRASWN